MRIDYTTKTCTYQAQFPSHILRQDLCTSVLFCKNCTVCLGRPLTATERLVRKWGSCVVFLRESAQQLRFLGVFFPNWKKTNWVLAAFCVCSLLHASSVITLAIVKLPRVSLRGCVEKLELASCFDHMQTVDAWGTCKAVAAATISTLLWLPKSAAQSMLFCATCSALRPVRWGALQSSFFGSRGLTWLA